MDVALRPSRAAPASNSRACPPPTSTSGRGLLVLTPACRRAPPRRRVVASPMAGVAAAAAAAGAGGAAAPLPPRPAHTLARQAALLLATARGALGVAAAMARALVVGSGHRCVFLPFAFWFWGDDGAHSESVPVYCTRQN